MLERTHYYKPLICIKTGTTVRAVVTDNQDQLTNQKPALWCSNSLLSASSVEEETLVGVCLLRYLFLCNGNRNMKQFTHCVKKKKKVVLKRSTGRFETCEKRSRGSAGVTLQLLSTELFLNPACVTLAYWPTEPCQEGGGVRWKVCVCVGQAFRIL